MPANLPTKRSPTSPHVSLARAPEHLTSSLLLSLQAFDWAVRLGSFRAAAAALHLTPSAVSHRIRNLERILGRSLFSRDSRKIRTTPEGAALAAVTSEAFTGLARATAATEPAPMRARLRLAVSPIFASAWLYPRLGAFLADHPRIEVDIEIVNRPINFRTELFDAAISWSMEDWPGLASLHLMDVSTTPVCTARMAESLDLRSAADLSRATLIKVTHSPVAWKLWFEHAGVEEVTPKQSISVDSYSAALHAAELGIGVALGVEPLTSMRPDGERLRQPLPVRHPYGAYWLVHRPIDQTRPGLREFRRWLVAQLAAPG